MTQQCLTSLFETADRNLYSLFIVDNGSTDGTVDYLRALTDPVIEDIVYLNENVGTAAALNRGWKLAYDRGQHAGKVDNDIVWYDTSWLNRMHYTLDVTADVGLVGLKRRDLEEKPNHNNPQYRTWLFTLPDGHVIEIARHIIGTCWLVKWEALKDLGALVQFGPYGLDDAIYCHRMHIAGYQTVFVPDIAIEHIDPGDPKYPEYTQWKIKTVTEVMRSGEYNKLMDAYRLGQRPVFEAFT
jgi:GT2 family glycosyltransferase